MSETCNRGTEYEEQCAFVEWCALNHIPVVHIPNEGKRSPREGARLIRAGLVRGFPDLFVPLPRGEYHGLFIEMKFGKNKPTREQVEQLRALCARGYAVTVSYGAEQAIRVTRHYCALGVPPLQGAREKITRKRE